MQPYLRNPLHIFTDERGATAIEYSLLASAISLCLIFALIEFQGNGRAANPLVRIFYLIIDRGA